MASVIVSTIYKIISTDVDKTTNKVKKLEKANKLATQSANRMGGAFRGAMKGLGVAVAAVATAIVAFIKLRNTIVKAVGAIDDMAKTAKNVSLTAEIFQEFAFVAGLSGVSVDLLEKSLQGLQRAAVQAINGSRQMVNIFAQLGISLDDLKKADTESLLNAVADGFNKLPNGINKSGLAMSLFQRRGARMLEFLRIGKEGIDELREQARKFGLVISNETVASIEQLNDELSITSERIGKRFTDIWIALGPIVNAVADGFADFLDAITTLVGINNSTQQLDRLNVELERLQELKKRSPDFKIGTVGIDDAIAKQELLIEKEKSGTKTKIGLQSTLNVLVAEEQNIRNDDSTFLGVRTFGMQKRQQEDLLKNLKEQEEVKKNLIMLEKELAQNLGITGEIALTKLMKTNDATILASKNEIARINGNADLKIRRANEVMDIFVGNEEQIKDAEASTAAAIDAINSKRTADLQRINRIREEGISRAFESIKTTSDAIILSGKSEKIQIIENNRLRIEALNNDLEVFIGNEKQKAELRGRIAEATATLNQQTIDDIQEINDADFKAVNDILERNITLSGAKTEIAIAEADAKIAEIERAFESFKGSEEDKLILAQTMADARVSIERDKNDEIAKIEEDRAKAEEKAANDAQRVWNEKNKILISGMKKASLKMSKSIEDFVLTGKGNFKELAASFLQDIARMIIRALVLKAIQTSLGAFGGFFGAAMGGASAGGNTASSDGNVFPGGVVSSRSKFNLGSGTGTIAERGPEAIMPLARDGSGNLGIKALGGSGGGKVVNINTTINVESGSTDAETAEKIRSSVLPAILNAVKEDIAKENRPGGSFNPVSSVGR